MRILITGAAGFIGAHLAIKLLGAGHEIVGIDNLNDYYAPTLKLHRLEKLKAFDKFTFVQGDIAEANTFLLIKNPNEIELVVNLAAQAGVRYSLTNPLAYAHSNLNGHLQVLEFVRGLVHKPLLIYASSSSVYGNGLQPPFKEDDVVNRPVSLYAATKIADEMLSHSYAHLYSMRQIGLRFFTVYGPMGRPDMAYWTFSEDILSGRSIKVFNHGKLRRDFTYIDDIIEGIFRMITMPAVFESGAAPHKIYNIGNNHPVELMEFIKSLEEVLGKKAKLEMLPMQMGDVYETSANIEKLKRDYGFSPATSLKYGLQNFADWFLNWKHKEGE